MSPPMTGSSIVTHEELISCQNLLFEWAESFDTKDWKRLAKCLAPTVTVDYRPIMGKLFEDLPANDFVGMVSDMKFLGDPLLKTQHLVGVSKWEKVSDFEIVSVCQVRGAHQRYADESLSTVALKGHAYGVGTMRYRKLNGEWKFAGLCPDPRWSEYDYAKMFNFAG